MNTSILEQGAKEMIRPLAERWEPRTTWGELMVLCWMILLFLTPFWLGHPLWGGLFWGLFTTVFALLPATGAKSRRAVLWVTLGYLCPPLVWFLIWQRGLLNQNQWISFWIPSLLVLIYALQAYLRWQTYPTSEEKVITMIHFR